MSLQKETLEEYRSMIQAGCEPISFSELSNRGKMLGYRLVVQERYVNNLNPGRSWKAMMCTWKEVSSGLNFSHVDAPRSHLPELQELRRNSVCLHQGHLVEC